MGTGNVQFSALPDVDLTKMAKNALFNFNFAKFETNPHLGTLQLVTIWRITKNQLVLVNSNRKYIVFLCVDHIYLGGK